MYAGLPEALSREDLEEITAQPLLNYLVALSFARGKLDFAETVNLNQIYYDLLIAVYERAYEKKRAFTPIKHMKFQDFVRILEEIGLAAWHGDGRTTTIREIEEHCKMSGVGRLLEAFAEGAKAGVTRLLAAFFFRQYGRRTSGDPTFVFTHKSFGEYLAARRVMRAMDRIVRERKISEEHDGEGWSERDALKHWAEICGPSPMIRYLHDFLLNEVAFRDSVSADGIQDAFVNLFSHMLRHNLPMELLQLPSFSASMRQSRNAEEALLAALNSCARQTRRISRIVHPDSFTFGTWLRRIQGQYRGDRSSLAVTCLSYLNLSSLQLVISDLISADLSHCDLSQSNLAHSYCFKARFDGAIMTGTQASDCFFGWSSFRGAQIRNCGLDGCNLTSAQLEGAVIRATSLANVNLDSTHLKGVDADAAACNALGILPSGSPDGGTTPPSAA